MQDIHAVGGGQFLGGGDRRMRPHNHPNNHLQALKCPRCDSQNTKFCYYNNYNLSQPRHFCKNCRRYWTKGGVLRNVPVGGGCRKTKRANQKRGAAKERTQSTSSTDSSNLKIAAGSSTAPVEEPLATTKAASISTTVYDFPDPSFFNANPRFDNRQQMVNHPSANSRIFPPEISGYANLLAPAPASVSSEMMVYGSVPCSTTSYSEVFHDSTTTATLESCNPVVDEIKLPEMARGLNCSDIAAAPEWVSGDAGEEQGLFDLTAAADPAYWSQSPWTDNDQPSLNFLP